MTSEFHIPINDVSFQGYNADELGRVFFYEGEIYRGVHPHKVESTISLMNCGLIQELISLGYFPETSITDHRIDGFGLVLKHSRIHPVVYPGSWSFDMLKDAALLLLEINKIAAKYGYQTIDGHGFNVLFNHCKPMFVDLGSFVPNTENPKGWIAYEVFLKSIYAPLRVMASGNIFMGRALLLLGTRQLPHYSYYQYRSPLYRLINPFLLERVLTTYHKIKAFTHYSEEEIEARAPRQLRKPLLLLKRYKLNPLSAVNLNDWQRRIKRTNLKLKGTQWGNYHDQFLNTGDQQQSTPRFDRIAEIVKDLGIKGILEVGGNQGLFSEILLEKGKASSIISTDYDEMAVNKMYLRLRNRNKPITPAVLDVVNTISGNYGPHVSERYRSEAVIALALTHHILLTQKIPLDKLISDLSLFCEQYLIIEYMPLGLYAGDMSKAPPLPDWYTEDFFRSTLEAQYEILLREQLEVNRIVFVGKKR